MQFGDYVCSNCGAACGFDARMGSMDVYLVCECASAKNSFWYNDGRGGYTIYKNNAQPITIAEYKKRNSQRGNL